MPFHMVYRQRWTAKRPGERASHQGTGQQGTGQTGTGRISHGINRLPIDIRRIEHFPSQRHQALDVIPRGQFRYDTAVKRVQIDLTEEPVRQQSTLGAVQSQARFITRRLDTKHDHWINTSATVEFVERIPLY